METRHKFSRKRQAILEMLQGTKDHPTAEMIYNRLKPEIPDLSLATVYRNLAAFQKEGLASVVANVAGNERYDAITYAHPHFVCRNCGSVCDLETSESINKAVANLTKDTDFKAETYTFSIYGICGRCYNKKKSAGAETINCNL